VADRVRGEEVVHVARVEAKVGHLQRRGEAPLMASSFKSAPAGRSTRSCGKNGRARCTCQGQSRSAQQEVRQKAQRVCSERFNRPRPDSKSHAAGDARRPAIRNRPHAHRQQCVLQDLSSSARSCARTDNGGKLANEALLELIGVRTARELRARPDSPPANVDAARCRAEWLGACPGPAKRRWLHHHAGGPADRAEHKT